MLKPSVKNQALDYLPIWTSFLQLQRWHCHRNQKHLCGLTFALRWFSIWFNWNLQLPPSSFSMKKVALPDKQEGEKILLLNSYLLNYVVASGGGSESGLIIFWPCQVTAHPLVPGSSLSLSDAPGFAVTECRTGNWWWALKAYFNSLRAASIASQNQKNRR